MGVGHIKGSAGRGVADVRSGPVVVGIFVGFIIAIRRADESGADPIGESNFESLSRPVFEDRPTRRRLIKIGFSVEIVGDEGPQGESGISERLRDHDADEVLRLGAEKKAGGSAEAVPLVARLDADVGVKLADGDKGAERRENAGRDECLFQKAADAVLIVDEVHLRRSGDAIADAGCPREGDIAQPIIFVIVAAVVQIGEPSPGIDLEILLHVGRQKVFEGRFRVEIIAFGLSKRRRRHGRQDRGNQEEFKFELPYK